MQARQASQARQAWQLGGGWREVGGTPGSELAALVGRRSQQFEAGGAGGAGEGWELARAAAHLA